MKLRTKHLVFLALCGAFLVYKWGNRAPSEAKMVAHFHKNRADFERLQKLLENRFDEVSIGRDWSRGAVYVPPGAYVQEVEERVLPESYVRECRVLIEKLDVSMAHRRTTTSRFPVFGGGFTDTSWSIGYAYSKTVPKNLVKLAYHTMPGQNKAAYSRIDGRWYLYHRR